jgi:hypothetical protein
MVRLGRLEEGGSDAQGREVSQAQEPEKMRRRRIKRLEWTKWREVVLESARSRVEPWEPVQTGAAEQPGCWWRMIGKLRPTT